MTVFTASSFYVERVRDVTVLCFNVRSLTEQNHDAVSDELLEFIALVTADRPTYVVAELSALQEVDDLGIAMLQAFHDSIDDAGGKLVLCRVPMTVMAALRRSDLCCRVARLVLKRSGPFE
jgi:anti-anti-sigma regulatory factor